jgi:hypothetical protein
MPGIPPVRVEVPVGKLQQLAQGVQERVEQQVEHGQPDQVVRQLQKKKNKAVLSIKG